MLSSQFHTLVTECGTGTQCTSQFALRTESAELAPQQFSGIGFSVDGLSARFAAEGEAIERATWRYGALWNTAFFATSPCYIPDDVHLLFSETHRQALQNLPCVAVAATSAQSQVLAIPSEAVFHYPKRRQYDKHHSVTTGWAFHLSRQQALAQAYREVIERDLQMLFWLERLQPFLHQLPLKTLTAWGAEFGLQIDQHRLKMGKNAQLYALQIAIALHPTINETAYFTLVIALADEPPYLSMGSALKAHAQTSFRSAIGECIMLRSHQYDLVLRGIKEAAKDTYTAHTLHASCQTHMRDKTQRLLDGIKTMPVQTEVCSESRLNYRHHDYQVAFFNPPPGTAKGVVAKVWVNGCQGMVPVGFSYGVCQRWQRDWQVSDEEWHSNRWHPYP